MQNINRASNLIGKSNFGGSDGYSWSYIDDLRFYNISLTQNELINIMNLNTSKKDFLFLKKYTIIFSKLIKLIKFLSYVKLKKASDCKTSTSTTSTSTTSPSTTTTSNDFVLSSTSITTVTSGSSNFFELIPLFLMLSIFPICFKKRLSILL